MCRWRFAFSQTGTSSDGVPTGWGLMYLSVAQSTGLKLDCGDDPPQAGVKAQKFKYLAAVTPGLTFILLFSNMAS